MRKLPITTFGTDAQGIRLFGDPARQLEPGEVRITFPGGDVEVVRVPGAKGEPPEYWVHVHVETGGSRAGRLVDARMDVVGKHASECDAGELKNPDLYHLAVRIARADETRKETT